MSDCVHFYYGPMGSGKTLALIDKLEEMKHSEESFLVFKPSLDTRSGTDSIRSRCGKSHAATSLDASDSIESICKGQQGCITWVLVDEVQFLALSQVEELRNLWKLGIGVLAYGLLTDYTGKMFPSSQRLLEVSDSVTQIVGTCTLCQNRPAIINSKYTLVQGEPVTITSDSPIIDVGGDDKYRALCWQCWDNSKEK